MELLTPLLRFFFNLFFLFCLDYHQVLSVEESSQHHTKIRLESSRNWVRYDAAHRFPANDYTLIERIGDTQNALLVAE